MSGRATLSALSLAVGFAGFASGCGKAEKSIGSGMLSAAAATAPRGGGAQGGRPVESKDACVSACTKDASEEKRRVCGTDGKTYKSCDWICHLVPSGVSVFPGACKADGSPPDKRPPAPADGKHVCDWFDNNGQWTAVECDSAMAPVAAAGLPRAKGLSPTVDLRATQGGLPDTTSHRARFGIVRDQASAPACVAFAGTAAIEGAIAREIKERVSLSEMHFLSHFRSTIYEDAIAALPLGAARDKDALGRGFVYDPIVANGWITGSAEPAALTVQELDTQIPYVVSSVRVLEPGSDGKISAQKLAEGIADGDDFLVGLMMSDNWYARNLLSGSVVEDYETGRNFGHAVLFIGYKIFQGRKYFEVRNSWGTGWGQSGYGFISYETAEANIQTAAAVSVRRRDGVLADACSPGTAAGLDGSCKKLCPDGSLEGEDGCRGPGTDCSSGMVHDASGVCVRACATKSEPVGGIRADCKEAGCVYHVPPGQYGCKAAADGACEHHCPAPSCEMAETTNEFGAKVLSCIPH